LSPMRRVLLVGSGAREHILAERLAQSREPVELYGFLGHRNPGIVGLCQGFTLGTVTDVAAVAAYAREIAASWACIGPDDPLALGLVDALAEVHVPAFGPTKAGARIESSKAYARGLLTRHGIPGCPRYRVFSSYPGVEDWVGELQSAFVLKPDGLTAGKGVQVQGDHFASREDGLAAASAMLERYGSIVVEEKLVGQEFSLLSITDGATCLHLPAVQDHKRAFEGDRGPNTGGMGTYSCADGSLPFLTAQDIRDAQAVNEATVAAIERDCGVPYRGVLYGGFMAVAGGVRVVEFNARFGDPEAMNVLTVLENDFVEVCEAVIRGQLSTVVPRFKPLATVCKYAVPEGYPEQPVRSVPLDVSQVDTSKVKLYFGSVDERSDGLYLKGSRAVAVVAQHQDLYQAEALVEEQIKRITGPVFHRADIATRELVGARVVLLAMVRRGTAV